MVDISSSMVPQQRRYIQSSAPYVLSPKKAKNTGYVTVNRPATNLTVMARIDGKIYSQSVLVISGNCEMKFVVGGGHDYATQY